MKSIAAIMIPKKATAVRGSNPVSSEGREGLGTMRGNVASAASVSVVTGYNLNRRLAKTPRPVVLLIPASEAFIAILF